MNIDDDIMLERRLMRLKHLTFFMTDDRAPKTNFLARECAHNLLTGWFSNSQWRTAWYCITQAASNSWMNLRVTVRVLYYRHILRLDADAIDAKFLAE